MTAARPETLTAPQKALRKLGLVRDIDLALHLPLRWEDETRIVRLADAREGEVVQIEAQVMASEIAYRPRRQLVVTVQDDTDSCVLRFFTFYPSMQKALAVGARVRVRGELRGGLLGWQMVHPVCKPSGGALPERLTPVYPTVAGLPQPYLRKAVLAGLARADLSETLPPDFLSEIGLQGAWGLLEALSFLHQPGGPAEAGALQDPAHPAWQRLRAEELLAQQLSQLESRLARAQRSAPPLAAGDGGLAGQLCAALPFALTGAQRRVLGEIRADMARAQPMHRLLQGDVGSGKTVVAALAACAAIDAGWQCALMAPTEILAEQHFGKLVGWLAPLLAPRGLQVAWLTGGQRKKARGEMLAAIADGRAPLAVGTHAVIQDQVAFQRLALAVIDEQHRFGVAQRLALRHKSAAPGHEPHLLMMSATPIPRTLAMSYYADLEVSTLDELPPGRTPIVTRLVAASRRAEVIARIRTQLAAGRQAYWVCPLIEESESLDLVDAQATHAALAQALPGTEVALLHSRLPPAEKKAVMARFAAGQTGVLVATTVIEVGVDVPNASLMVVEHAERFGLAQLHQLRGRVGRGTAASACVLLYSAGEGGQLGEQARARLKAMVETQDGFEIARRDLAIRGPGEFLGARQSGQPLLRFADLTRDAQLLAAISAAAPAYRQRHPELARRHLSRWLGGKSDYLKA